MTSNAGRVQEVLEWLERCGSRKYREGYARYGIHAAKAFGVSVSSIQALGKRLGRDHDLAAALWETGWYEARLLCSFVDDPALVSSAQMDRWARDFDNWGICDTVCFHLFDRTPLAWRKVEVWSGRQHAFVKRAAFALLAGLALHDKRAPDASFRKGFGHIERAATDDRNFVKKGVSWALRVVGRRSPGLHVAALDLARRLAERSEPSARWVGKDAVRDLTRPAVVRLVARRAGRT